MDPMLDHQAWRWGFLLVVGILLMGSIGLVGIGMVEVKMLPFDNKSEFQVIIDAPEGTTLEETTRMAQEMANVIRLEPEVENIQVYSGTASPFNFNGLVRHYFLRKGPNVADLQVNLVGKHDRTDQSHAIAGRIRPQVSEIARKYGAAVAIAEVPPGPPVLQTIVAEIYGPDADERIRLAGQMRDIMSGVEGVVDIDWYVEEPRQRKVFVADEAKAALHGLSDQEINQSISLATGGLDVDLLHLPDEREDVMIRLELSDQDVSKVEDVLSLNIRPVGRPDMPLIPLTELVQIRDTQSDQPLYRKNLKPVTYVTADVAGAIESPAYALFKINKALKEIDAREYGGSTTALPLYHMNQPFDDLEPAVKWDGEWHITLEVFRDLGLAFAPAHWALGAFFTATSMIGFMAGAGIVVRNSIILVDFIELRRKQGLPLRDAVVEAGAVRFRPMLLTALAVVVGASVILADPIFQGLAISLMFGEIASLGISRMAVPILYYMSANKDED
jgi:multidrug efflux pump subunit AcrB